MSKYNILTELNEIHYKYERLTSLIGILQMFVEEVVEVTDAPADSLTNALFEIELDMEETNNRLKKLIEQKKDAA